MTNFLKLFCYRTHVFFDTFITKQFLPVIAVETNSSRQPITKDRTRRFPSNTL